MTPAAPTPQLKRNIAGGVFLMVATITEAPRNALLGIGLTLAGLPFYYWSKRSRVAG